VRIKDQPRTASKMAKSPAATNTNPSGNEESTNTMPAMRHNAPITPRAVRPVRWRLGRKKLDT